MKTLAPVNLTNQSRQSDYTQPLEQDSELPYAQIPRPYSSVTPNNQNHNNSDLVQVLTNSQEQQETAQFKLLE